jgi:hypothetical protein
MRHGPPGQLGFDAFLFVADEANRQLQTAREGAHLPDTLDEALPFEFSKPTLKANHDGNI